MEERRVQPTVYGIRGHRELTENDVKLIQQFLAKTPPPTKEEIQARHPELFEWEK